MDFAIFRIAEAENVIDRYFGRNYTECQKYNISTGVYKYSYAMNITEMQNEARKVISVLKGRKLLFPVWLDMEWNNQRSLGTEKNYKMAVQFQGKNPWYQWNCR
ncbi:GH25 family lysozyme [Blautia luti]|uniref:GH25 family lysozyme n=1 Tax=Blautia luti TaxID=89014 RepID=UPI0018AB1CDE|nr:GH25 family lysozyme [Blautia luti]